MLARVAAHHVEFGIENVLSMSSVLHAVVYDQLYHHLLGLLAVEAEVFTVACNNVPVLSQPLLYTRLAI